MKIMTGENFAKKSCNFGLEKHEVKCYTEDTKRYKE